MTAKNGNEVTAARLMAAVLVGGPEVSADGKTWKMATGETWTMKNGAWVVA